MSLSYLTRHERIIRPTFAIYNTAEECKAKEVGPCYVMLDLNGDSGEIGFTSQLEAAIRYMNQLYENHDGEYALYALDDDDELLRVGVRL